MMRHAGIVLALLAASVCATAEGSSLPGLSWQPCGNNAQCTQIAVPLDWQHPHGEQISLALIRHRASDPARRIGTLVFMNCMDYVAQRSAWEQGASLQT